MIGDFVQVCEVGPRDGLQGEPNRLSTEDKLTFLQMLQDSGISRIELGSFVNPKIMPNMADTDELFLRSANLQGVSGLIFNEKGLSRALESGCSKVVIVTFVSPTLCQKVTGKTLVEFTQSSTKLIQKAKELDLWVRVDLAPAWVCPYEGKKTLSEVGPILSKIIQQNPDEIALADTIGHADPGSVSEFFREIAKDFDVQKLAAHFHDTQSLALANTYAALEQGVRIFDSSIAALGGCPFAPGAQGNLATEDLVFLLNKLGCKHSVEGSKLPPIISWLNQKLDRELKGRTI